MSEILGGFGAALLWSIAGAYAAYVTLVVSFIAVMRAYVLHESGVHIHWFWRLPIWTAAVIGKALDIVWNWTVGCGIFRERPHETTFTSRCKRHKTKLDWRGERARWWCRQFEIWHEGHCR